MDWLALFWLVLFCFVCLLPFIAGKKMFSVMKLSESNHDNYPI